MQYTDIRSCYTRICTWFENNIMYMININMYSMYSLDCSLDFTNIKVFTKQTCIIYRYEHSLNLFRILFIKWWLSTGSVIRAQFHIIIILKKRLLCLFLFTSFWYMYKWSRAWLEIKVTGDSNKMNTHNIRLLFKLCEPFETH